MNPEAIPIITATDFTRLKGYIPLGESEEGLVGQAGSIPWPFGGREPVYDPNAPVWEIQAEESGKFFMWRHKTQCFGVPVGECQNRIPESGGAYCATCAPKFDQQSKSWRAGERRKNIINEGVAGGWIPRMFETWEPPSLYPQQQTVLVQLQHHDLQCAWIQGLYRRGKTYVAYTVMYQYLMHCRKVAYLDAIGIKEAHKNRYLYNGAVDADLLVIDDLPIGLDVGWLVSVLHGILDARNQPKRRTIITSQQTPEDCANAFAAVSGGTLGANTIERLNFNQAPCIFVEIKGENLGR